jgi:hypothetical protein
MRGVARVLLADCDDVRHVGPEKWKDGTWQAKVLGSEPVTGRSRKEGGIGEGAGVSFLSASFALLERRPGFGVFLDDPAVRSGTAQDPSHQVH